MYTTHNPSLDDIDSEPISIPSLVKIIPGIETNCHLCRKTHGQLYPCRICGKVYHQRCIKDVKTYHLIKNAFHLIGRGD